MNQFMRKDYAINNLGSVNAIKSSFDIRLLNFNIKGLPPKNKEQIERSIASIENIKLT